MKKLRFQLAVSGSLLLMPLFAFATSDDQTPPKTVENVQAYNFYNSPCYKKGDKEEPNSICVTWNVGIDDDVDLKENPVKSTGIAGYKIYYGKKSVQEEETDQYETVIDFKEIGNVTKYKIQNLDKDTQYYLSVTAVDKSGNLETQESEAYSLETSIKTGAKTEVEVQQDDFSDLPPEVKAAIEEENASSSTNIDTATNTKEISNFVLNIKKTAENKTSLAEVILKWTPNSSSDIINQMLYISKNGGISFGAPTSLNNKISNQTIKNLINGKTYAFKVTTKDKNNKESKGTIKTIKIPETGMGIGIALAASSIAAISATRKKKEKTLKK